MADGVICGLGLTPEVIALSLAAIERGARAAGRTLDDVDVWWFAKTSLADTRAAAIEPIKMALAASANHAFRFTLEGKGVPPDLHEKIRALQREYNAHHHEIPGAANASLPDRWDLTEFLADRFAIAGSARRLRGPAPARDGGGGASVHDHRLRAGSARLRAPVDEGGRRRSLILAAFRVRSFRFQWPADLLTSWAFEMETLILGWYVMVQTGSVLLLTLFGSAQFLGTLAAPMFGVLGDRVGGRLMLCAMRAIYAAVALAVMLLAFSGRLTPAWAIALAALNGVVRPNDLVMRNALIGETIPPDHLMGALGMSRATMDSARVGGALAGAGLSTMLGIGLTYLFVTCFYLASLALTFGVARARPVPDFAASSPSLSPSRGRGIGDGVT